MTHASEQRRRYEGRESNAVKRSSSRQVLDKGGRREVWIDRDDKTMLPAFLPRVRIPDLLGITREVLPQMLRNWDGQPYSKLPDSANSKQRLCAE